MRIFQIVGARPNFMKAAPVIRAVAARGGGLAQKIVHTGQHYDSKMSDIFFRQLGIPAPDYNLEVGSGSHAVQTAEIMVRFERLVLQDRPDLVLVYGDVNSTVAAAIVSAKLGIKIGHVEAGLRSRDRTMPEEINRVLTDQISDLFFTPSYDGDENLKRENISADRIFMVGNLMIDTLVRLLPEAVRPALAELEDRFVLVTLHRPSNVDEPGQLRKLMNALAEISRRTQVVFPVHPRTRQRLGQLGLHSADSRLLLAEPLGYLEFLWLQQHAITVVTDSGGIQEETTYLGVPCLTMRENTERPVTVDVGTNKLIGKDTELLKKEVEHVLEGRAKKGAIPPLWDGKAGERLVEVLLKHSGKQKTES